MPALRDRIDERAATYAETAGERAVADARRDLRVLEQAAAYRRAYEGRPADGDPFADETAVREVLAVRDRAMADNVAWVVDRTDGAVAVWGHDDHVARDAQRPRQADVTAPSMGRRLAAAYGEAYLAVGFEAERFGFQALGPSEDGRTLQGWAVDGPLPGTTEATVAAAVDGPAVLDVRAAAADDRSADWLAASRPRFSVGNSYDPESRAAFRTERAPTEAFDLLCHLRETERARPTTGEDG